MTVHESLLTLSALYVSAMAIGMVARQRRKSLGHWHHVLYACTCLAFLWSLLHSPRPAHTPMALVLTLLPLTRPRSSRRHDLIGLAGVIALIILIAF